MWESITRDPWILKTIGGGVRVNLSSIPIQNSEPKEKSWSHPQDSDLEWLDAALSWNAIELVPEDRIGEPGELLHNLISEPKKGRLCSNTYILNLLAKKMGLKMESLKDVRQRFRKDHWMASFDLSKFYWSTLINPSHRRYFHFRIDGKMWQWRALPFGYKNSMQIMYRLMAPVVV
jgi:hypothetical protein